jgi:CPA2 family monovalent cation:H+ antiporter-2
VLSFTLLITFAAIGFAMSRVLRIPVVPVLMLSGAVLSLLGQAVPGMVRTSAVELGATFLAFTVGLELNPQRFGQQKVAVLRVGLLQMLVVASLGFCLSLAFGFELFTAMYVACAVSASSTLVVLRHLKQQQQLFEPFGRTVIGVLLLQDVIMMLVIAVLARITDGATAVAIAVVAVVAMGGLALAAQRYLIPSLVLHMKLDEESLLLSTLAIVVILAAVAIALGLPPVIGAFLTGFAFSSFPVNGVVRGLLSSLSDFFLALFFVALGSLLQITSPLHTIYALLLALFIVVVTPPLVTIVAERTGLSARASIESGLLLAQVSEFSLVAVLTGVQLGHIPFEVFSILALTTMITMALTPFIATDRVTSFLLHLHPFRLDTGAPTKLAGHVLILGFGAGGMWVVRPLLAEGYQILVVDDDPAVIEQLLRRGIPCIRGDGSDPRTLERARGRDARLIIASMRRVEDCMKVVRAVPDVPVVVRLFERADADRVRALGGIPILNSIAAADTFMDWFATSGLAREPLAVG